MNASSDREWDRSIAIGEQNAQIVELAHRHCQLMKFVESGGRGMLEEATGLPINMRQIECPKAHGTTSGMRLDWIAGEFYRANCVGCDMRRPTGEMPTLATLMAQEDAAAAKRESEIADARSADLDDWRKRSDRRHAEMVAADQATVAILKDLEIVDASPSTEPEQESRQRAIARLTAVASRAPQLFTQEIVQEIGALIEEQAQLELLAPLRIVALDRPAIRDDVIGLALRILQTVADPEAARTLVQFSEELSNVDLLETVVRRLVTVACAPQYGNVGHLGPNTSQDPSVLLLAADLVPDVLEKLLDGMLPPPAPETPLLLPPAATDTEDKERVREFERGTAAAAIAQLLTRRPTLATPLLTSLVRNVVVEGDHYDTYPSHRVAKTLALAIFLDIGDVPMKLETSGTAASEDWRERLFDVWEALAQLTDASGRSREADDPEIPDGDKPGMRDRLLEVSLSMMDGRWGSSVVLSAARLIERLADDAPAWAFTHRDALLGGAMTALQTMTKTGSAPLITPQQAQDPFAGLTAMNERTAFMSAAHSLLKSVGEAAKSEPMAVLLSLTKLLENERDTDAELELSYRLIPLLGTIGASHGSDPAILRELIPTLYTYLVGSAPALSSRAMDAWVAVARRHRLPSTFEDLLPALVSSPYIMVIKSLLRAAGAIPMSDESNQLLFRYAFQICHVLPTSGPEAELLVDAIRATLRLGTRIPSLLEPAEALALKRSADLDGYELEKVLQHRWSEQSKVTPLMAELRLRQVANPQVNDRFNSHGDPELVSLLESGSGLLALSLADLVAVAKSFGAQAVIRGAELAEVIWRAGRLRDVSAIVGELALTVPDQPAFEFQRKLLEVVASAANQEILGHTQQLVPPVPTEETHGTIQDLIRQTRLRATIHGLLARPDVDGVLDPTDRLAQRAAALDRAGEELRLASQRSTATAAYLRGIGNLCKIAAQLLRFDATEIKADEAGRLGLLRSIKRLASNGEKAIAARFFQNDPIAEPLRLAFVESRKISEGGDVDATLLRWSSLTVPLIIISGEPLDPQRPRFVPETAKEPTPVGVVFASINRKLLTGAAVLQPDVVYALEVEVDTQVWPDWAQRLDLEFVGQLGEHEVQLPSFSWSRPAADQIDEALVGEGTMILHFRLPAGAKAPPFMVTLTWRGEKDGQPMLRPLDVAGHPEIRLRPYDSSRDAITQYEAFDERLLALYAMLPEAGYSETEIQAFCRLFTAICRIGLRLTWDKRFKRGQRVTEKQFHDELFERLLKEPELEGRVERGSPLGLGFLDIRHDKITAELKVERHAPVTRDSAPRYMAQVTQYASADGARLSILAILDMSPKELPIGTPENYMFPLVPAQHGIDDPLAPSLVVTLVVNGNLPNPSSWSRRSGGRQRTPSTN
jgi:hypothetical protein